MMELFAVSPEQTDKGMGLKLCFVHAVFSLSLSPCLVVKELLFNFHFQ